MTSCRWLYPKKDAKEPVANLDKGQTKASVKNKEWVPLQTNPSGIGSSNAFAALEVTNTKVMKIVKDIADNTFSFPLQNIVDHVAKRTMPQVTEPVLTLATNETQDELHAEGDEVHSGSATSSPVVSAIPLISAEEHDQVNDEVMDANFPVHGAGLSADVSIGGEDSTSESVEDDILVIDVDTTRANMDGVPS